MLRKKFPEFVPCRYETFQDVRDRLDGTLCRYEGKVVYVKVIGSDDEDDEPSSAKIDLRGWPDTDVRIKHIKPDDPALDISIFDLGYVNYIYQDKNVVLYPYRNTGKSYKQGTYLGHVYTSTIDGKNSDHGSYALQCQGFVDMLEGRYPVLAALNFNNEIALSPDLAVRVDDLGVREFFWRRKKIAVQVPKQKIHRLQTEFTPLVDKIIGEYL